MKRIALVGVLVCLAAGIASAQTDSDGVPRELGSQRVILKGIGAEGRVMPAAASSLITSVTVPQQMKDGADAPTEMAKCNGCGQEWTNCCCSCCWTISGGYLYLQPRGADAVFALRSTACAGAAPAPLLGLEQIDFGAESGFTIGLARALCDGGEIAVNWMHFESTETGRATAIPPQTLFPFLITDPLATCNAATSSLARATQGIDFDRVVLDYRNNFEWCCMNFDWAVGFAYGQLDQDLSARYDDSRFVRVSSQNWGYGAHFGAGAEKVIGCIRGFTHIDLTLLASNAKASYRHTETGLGAVSVVTDVEHDIDRIIPVLDIELGMAYDVCSNTTVKIGYLYSIWYNVLTTPDFVRNVQTLNFDSNDGETLTFDGLFARVEVRW